MHTIKVIAGGLVLLAVCLLIGRWIGGPTPAMGLAKAANVFIPLWLVASGVNMWVGVSKAGYSVADEAPIFVVVFAVPAAVAFPRAVGIVARLAVAALTGAALSGHPRADPPVPGWWFCPSS